METEKVIYPQGWRGTIGLIVPSQDTTHPEHETRYLLPEGVGLICQRLFMDYPRVSRTETLRKVYESLPDTAYLLKTAGADVICFSWASACFPKGREFELQLAGEIEKASGLPSVTVAGAVADAIRFLGAKKVLLIQSYPPDISKELEKYLREDQNIGLHFVYKVELETWKTPWQHYQSVLDAWRASAPGADAIFFSVGGIRLVEVIPLLEVETGVPILSSNLCHVWKCLQVLGIHGPIHGKGKLLEIPR